MMQRPILFSILFSISSSVAMAAPTPTLSGACVPPSNAVTAERATEFLAQPEGLLGQYKEGQGGLASAVRDMVMIRPETVEGVGSMARTASADQNRAIGAGLGTAALVCALSQPATAQHIQEIVLKTQNEDLVKAFASITGDIPTAAIPSVPATGDATAGGGRGTTSEPRSGGAIPTQTNNASSFLVSAQPNATPAAATTLFVVAARVANANVLGSVSPAE